MTLYFGKSYSLSAVVFVPPQTVTLTWVTPPGKTVIGESPWR